MSGAVDAAGTSRRVGVIGLGSMGYGIATALRAAGFDVAGCDVLQANRDRFAADGGRVANTPAEAAEGAAAIVSVVVNHEQTEKVLFGDAGCSATLAPNTVVISCATIPPRRADAFAARLAERSCAYLDAPISGGAARAARGELTIMASGSDEAFANAASVLDAIAARVFRLGSEPGTGSSFKLVNQLLAGVHIAAASEALMLAKKLGLDIRQVYDVITESAGNSWMFQDRMAHVVDGGFDSGSAVGIFVKDLGIVADVSRDLRAATPIASSALQMFLMTAAAGLESEGDASVARLYARVDGLEP